MDSRLTKQWHKKYEKCQCYTQRIPSSPKILEKFNEQKVFHEKLFLKIWQYSLENTCVGVFF